MSQRSGSELGLRELVARAKPTECPFCGDPRKASRLKPHLTCGDEACKRAYQRLWKRDLRRLAYAVGEKAADVRAAVLGYTARQCVPTLAGALRQFDAKVGQAAARANDLTTARTGRVGGIP